LCATIAGEASTRGKHIQEAGRQARERINADFNIDDPHMPPRASQKLVAVSTLLRAMLKKSRPLFSVLVINDNHRGLTFLFEL
jgi:hypothetical protein